MQLPPVKTGFRQSIAVLHTWAGLLPGWLLFVIFLFGTAAFFQQEISRWMRPELQAAPVSARALDAAGELLRTRAARSQSWNISVPSPHRLDGLAVSWLPEGGGRSERKVVNLQPATGKETIIRDTRGGHFLYRFHFDLHYMPVMRARMIVSIAALAMLVTILTGIITHKKIFADFFLLRFGKGQRSWLDAHNVSGVLALPFHLMMTYTGLVTLLFTLMPWAISVNFPTADAFYEAAFSPGLAGERSGKPATLLPLSMLVAKAESILGAPVGDISVQNPGDESTIVQASPASNRLGGPARPVYLNGTTGIVVRTPPIIGGAQAAERVMIDLHAGRFAQPVLRWLYFLSGVGGTVMIASGLVLWTVKRRAKLPDPEHAHFGFRLVERLNIGVISGAPAGIAVYFLANRLLPLDIAQRADWEINSLFIAWGGLFVWTLARPAKRAWTDALAACALLYAAVPIVSTVTTRRGLISSLAAHDWVFAGFDLTMLATAALFAFAARKVATHRPKAASGRKAAPVLTETAA